MVMLKKLITSATFFVGAAICFAMVGVFMIIDLLRMDGEWK